MNARLDIASVAAPPRMAPLARLPLFFSLTGKRALVAGGNAAAAWKAELLFACGARVAVVAADLSEEMTALADAARDGAISIERRAWTAGDLRGAAIAIGAFDDDEAAASFAQAARAAGVPVNVVDKPAFCDFSFGSIVNRSPLVIGISTDGAAPVFAQAVRTRIEMLLPRGFAAWAAAASRWRARLKTTGLSFAGRRKFWHLFTAKALANAAHGPAERDFATLIADVGKLGAAVDSGSIAIVDAGPGDADLLTLRAVRALQSADVIVFDKVLPPAMLDLARREAARIAVRDDDDATALMENAAAQGKRVVRLRRTPPRLAGENHAAA